MPIDVSSNQHNNRYLETKREKMGHMLTPDKSMQKPKNNIELEIKFLIAAKNVPKIKTAILAVPELFPEGKMYEKTTMLDNPEKTMDQVDARLRVRQISRQKTDKDAKIEFSYKRRIKADGGIKKEEEIETAFTTNIDSFFHILNKMGYEVTTSYERFRETYKANHTKITLDEFPFGYILEIEGPEKNIDEVCGTLKLDKKKSYALSCDDAYVELCKKNKITPKDHILFDDPEMPHI